MKVALVPLNSTVGDIDGNAARMQLAIEQILACPDAAKGHDQSAGTNSGGAPSGVDLIVFPELAICGYPPKDLLYQEGFLKAAEAAAARVGAAPVTVIIGVPLPGERGGITNSLLAYRDGVRIARYDKRLLPTYDVFDEDRYFVPGDRPVIIDVLGVPVGLSICEDLWRGEDVGFSSRYADRDDPVTALINAGARVIVNPSASPFVLGKGRRHHDLLAKHAIRHRVPVLAVNQLGGNDELVFDGHAAAIGPAGETLAATAGFDETPLIINLDPTPAPRQSAAHAGAAAPSPSSPIIASATTSAPAAIDPYLATPDEELLFHVLVLGVRDYLRKTGFKSAVIGLSGGIDSAVTAVIAAAALGPANVMGVALPSRYSSEGSKSDAADLAQRLGMPYSEISIEDGFTTLLDTLAPAFAGTASGVAEENLQSRLRGTILMALSNKFGHLLLTTGNKSELAVGYCTLYGDMNGGLAVLSDVTKQWVYRLARWINANPAKSAPAARAPGASGGASGGAGGEAGGGGPIPESSITKPPSAELRPNQTDQDSLPPYDVLDAIIERYVEGRQSAATIVQATGFDPQTVSRILRLIDISEFKRKQAAIGLKVTSVAFGSGRRVPIAQRWRA